VTDGGREAAATGSATVDSPLAGRAAAVAVAAAVATVLLGLGSSAFADWIAPVLEGWLWL
jgi:hypothetical protein